MKRKTGEFFAHDHNGRQMRIVEYTDFLDAQSFESSGVVEEFKSYQTSDGQKLNVISEDEFEVRLTGEVLKRVKK